MPSTSHDRENVTDHDKNTTHDTENIFNDIPIPIMYPKNGWSPATQPAKFSKRLRPRRLNPLPPPERSFFFFPKLAGWVASQPCIWLPLHLCIILSLYYWIYLSCHRWMVTFVHKWFSVFCHLCGVLHELPHRATTILAVFQTR